MSFLPEKSVRTIERPVERKAYKLANDRLIPLSLYRLGAKWIPSNLILDSVALPIERNTSDHIYGILISTRAWREAP